MDELMNLMIADESLKPAVANTMLGYDFEPEEDVETAGELDNDEETEEEE